MQKAKQNSVNNKKKNNLGNNRQPEKKIIQPVKKDKEDKTLSLIIGNVISGAMLLLLLTVFQKNNKGYKWMWNNLVKNNQQTLSEYSYLTDYEKNLQRHGNLFKYLDNINKNTPDDAIILMPPDSVIDKLNPKLKLSSLKSRILVTYFIYPRRAVYNNNEWDKNIISKANYIAIVNYSGYEKLSRPPAKKLAFTVLPLR